MNLMEAMTIIIRTLDESARVVTSIPNSRVSIPIAASSAR